jgi:hypothetical protein
MPTDTKLQVIELQKIDKELKGNYIVHLSADEWKKATHNIPVSDYDGKRPLPKDGLLTVPVDPYDPRLGVIVLPLACPNDCVKKHDPNDPFGRCDCPPTISTPGVGGGSGNPGPHVPECHPTWGPGGIFACLGPACHGCKPKRSPIKIIGGLVIGEYIFCDCG